MQPAVRHRVQVRDLPQQQTKRDQIEVPAIRVGVPGVWQYGEGPRRAAGPVGASRRDGQKVFSLPDQELARAVQPARHSPDTLRLP